MLSNTSVGLEYGRVKVVVYGYLWLFVAVFGTVSVAVDSTRDEFEKQAHFATAANVSARMLKLVKELNWFHA